jgi:predicted tellurium resistance membrane protein TerC
MGSKQVADKVGLIGAVVVCFFLVRYMSWLSNQIALPWFMAICGLGLAALCLIAWRMDKRDEARRERERSDRL